MEKGEVERWRGREMEGGGRDGGGGGREIRWRRGEVERWREEGEMEKGEVERWREEGEMEKGGGRDGGRRERWRMLIEEQEPEERRPGN